MPVDPRLPVIVGVGQVVQHAASLEDAREPVELMADAARVAAADARLPELPAIDSVRVVALLSWRYRDPGRLVADELQISPREIAYSTMGGNTPQSLVNATAAEIQRGDLDMALVTGAECWRTRMRARREGVDLEWRRLPEGTEPARVIGTEMNMGHPAEAARGITMPVQVYPMFETALRAAAGEGVDEHQVKVSELWARFSAVAAKNPYAWSQRELTPAEIRTPGPSNRIIGFPYLKYMNSNNDVDMAAAALMCSVERARSLGVPEDQWVFVHAGTDCHDTDFVSNRSTFSASPAIRIGGARVLELAGIGIDDVDVVDLYSCFPSAVQTGAAALGLATDRQLTRTGGLAFAGGPWNNYVLHAIATVVSDVRERPGEPGLVWANGGFITKHSFGIYSTSPPQDGFRHDAGAVQAEVERVPGRELAEGEDAAGTAVIEGYSVMHSREGTPERALVSCLRPDGRRAWGTSGDTALATAMCESEWVGREVLLDSEGTLHVP
jgi:acetyl-CoA C-acetyltransferase